ncbi:MAG: helix-turn-helix domain-containing protein, partial [Actinophytocola sp.]|nr:helix-turn-helix domain-containing protein [Actinophytocola sp.]
MTCRWAVSPLRETTSAVRLLSQPHRQGYHLPWLRAVAPVLDRLDLTPLLHVLSRHSYSPDFISPPPAGPSPRFDDEIAAVRATPESQVAAELARSPGARRFATDPAEARTQLADVLESVWRNLIEPWWPRIRDILEADIAHRTRALVDGGLAAALADLHPAIRWEHHTLTVDLGTNAERRMDGVGMLLMPSVFEWPGVGVSLDPPWPPTIDYPARGIAALWQQVEPAEQLHRLIGRTRATLLAALSEPRSTTGLARTCALPASTVSEQVRILRETGLVTTHRVG